MKHRLQLQGRWTNSDKELIAECDLIREGLARYGLTVIGYDPGALVCEAGNPNSSAFSLPTWFIKRLLATPTAQVPAPEKESERDAARYRWLRDYAVRFDLRDTRLKKSPWCIQGTGHEDCWPCDGAELDALVDAAMQSTPSKTETDTGAQS